MDCGQCGRDMASCCCDFGVIENADGEQNPVAFTTGKMGCPVLGAPFRGGSLVVVQGYVVPKSSVSVSNPRRRMTMLEAVRAMRRRQPVNTTLLTQLIKRAGISH